jgi:hypothetical protein
LVIFHLSGDDENLGSSSDNHTIVRGLKAKGQGRCVEPIQYCRTLFDRFAAPVHHILAIWIKGHGTINQIIERGGTLPGSLD